MTSESCKYLVPSPLLASQAVEKMRRARKRAMTPQPLSYSTLIEKTSYLVSTKLLNAQTCANRTTALRKFLRLQHLSVEDVVGNEMRTGYPDALEPFIVSLQGEGSSARAISNTKSALGTWKQMVSEHDAVTALGAGRPTPFQLQLKELVGVFPIKRVAKQAAIPYDALLGWFNGKVPRAGSARYIARLEAFFALQRGSLASIAGVSHAPRLRPLLGAVVPIAYRSDLAARIKHEYYFRPEPESLLREQWLVLMRYKTDAVPVLERTNRGKWRVSPLPFSRTTAVNWFMFLDGQEVASAKAAWAKVGGFLGWLMLPVDEGGKGLPKNLLHTLAWLVVPELVRGYVEWYKRRGGGRYNKSAPNFLGYVISLVRPGQGYFPQNPELRDTLPEQYRLGNWEQMCAKQMTFCRKFTNSLLGQIEVTRNPFDPIRAVVSLPEPMEAIADMVQRMRADRPIGNLRSEAIWARDIALVKMFASNPLRVRQFSHMTWNAENTGNLYQRTDGSWWIRWRKKFFKNTIGAAGDIDYDSPVNEAMWTDIDRYIFRYRAALMGSQTELVFLVAPRGAGAAEKVHRPWLELSRRIQALTKRYLWQCHGVGGHAFRHIVATSILKASPNEFKTAALVLNDRMETVERHYAFLRSGDGSNRMGELLAKSFKRM